MSYGQGDFLATWTVGLVLLDLTFFFLVKQESIFKIMQCPYQPEVAANPRTRAG